MEWWIWITGGLLLLGLELLTPGTLFWIFFAAGAMVTGLVGAAWPGVPVLVQGSLFSTVSLASLAVFRKPLRDMVERRTPRAESIDTMIGETAIALADIAPGAVGKAELRGTAWSATNASADPIPASRRCRVDRVDGLMLFIRGSSQGE